VATDTTQLPSEHDTGGGTTGAGDLQGRIWQPASDEDLRLGLEKAFDYRGDVTITCKSGVKIEGYIFDRQTGATLESSIVRVIPKDQRLKISIPYSDIAGLAFTGRDTAAGRSWAAWLKKYLEKKAAGEKNIELKPEKLD
jgi:hypothetical protein